MVEEIKVLLPLLQQATTGALWLVVLMFAKDVLLWGGLIVAIATTVRYICRRIYEDADRERAHKVGSVQPLQEVWLLAHRLWLRASNTQAMNDDMYALMVHIKEMAEKRGIKVGD